MKKNIFLFVLLIAFMGFSVNLNGYFRSPVTATIKKSANQNEEKSTANNNSPGSISEDLIDDLHIPHQNWLINIKRKVKITPPSDFLSISNPLLEIITPPPQV